MHVTPHAEHFAPRIRHLKRVQRRMDRDGGFAFFHDANEVVVLGRTVAVVADVEDDRVVPVGQMRILQRLPAEARRHFGAGIFVDCAGDDWFQMLVVVRLPADEQDDLERPG
jgi:hypothetical protein